MLSCPNGNTTPLGGGTCGTCVPAELRIPPFSTVIVTFPPGVDTVIAGSLNVTVLSDDVDASFGLGCPSATTPAAIEATTVPDFVIPLTVTVYVGPTPV